MLVGLPDLDALLPQVPAVAYRAFGRNGLVVAVPDQLRLDLDSDGRPRLLLTLVRGGGGNGVWTTDRLELGLMVECDFEGIGRALAADATPGLVSVAELEGGVLSLAATLGPLAPLPLAPAQALPPEMLTRMRAIVELDAEAAVVAARARQSCASHAGDDRAGPRPRRNGVLCGGLGHRLRRSDGPLPES